MDIEKKLTIVEWKDVLKRLDALERQAKQAERGCENCANIDESMSKPPCSVCKGWEETSSLSKWKPEPKQAQEQEQADDRTRMSAQVSDGEGPHKWRTITETPMNGTAFPQAEQSVKYCGRPDIKCHALTEGNRCMSGVCPNSVTVPVLQSPSKDEQGGDDKPKYCISCISVLNENNNLRARLAEAEAKVKELTEVKP
jgi:hypothetical protein